MCRQNAGRSQMSAALFERGTDGRHRALSAGTTPADRVHPEVVEVMRELDIDVADRVPRKLTRELEKLMVYAGEQAHHAGHPLQHQLIRALRDANADGATSIRGIWGYHGDHRPHGDTFWQLRRRVPVVTIVIDTPERIRRWFAIVDELTDDAGLVTSEMVPAFHATGPDTRRRGLRLAERLVGS